MLPTSLVRPVFYSYMSIRRLLPSDGGDRHSQHLLKDKKFNGFSPRDASHMGMDPHKNVFEQLSRRHPVGASRKSLEAGSHNLVKATASQSWFTDAGSLASRPMA